MNNQLYNVIVALQVMVILSVFAFIAAGDEILLRLNQDQQKIELSDANLNR